MCRLNKGVNMKLSKLIERLDKLFAEDDLGDYEIDLCSELGGRQVQEVIDDLTVSHKSKRIILLGNSFDKTKDDE